MSKPKYPERALGMDQSITRRDFLNGVALSAAALGASSNALFAAAAPDSAGRPPLAAQDALNYYPPLLTGLRGSHIGSFEAAHALRDGKSAPEPADTGEEFDLIVVGAGISGLSAAHFYRARSSAHTRILVLDNHDDFGGHAKRNEFNLDGHLHLMNGGTLEIDSPRPYGKVAADLLMTLGLDVPKLARKTQQLEFYPRRGLQKGMFFDRETFGADQLVVGLRVGSPSLAKLLEQTPLSAQARRDILNLETAAIDYWPELSSEQKKDRLSRMSYEAFLRDVVKVDPQVIAYYHARTMGEWAVGADAVSALDLWGFGEDAPGFKGMKLAKGSTARMGSTPAGYADTGGSYRLHLPDGNATIARLLVQNLVPRAFPTLLESPQSAEAIVTARLNYASLDVADAPVRIRLNSTVIRARHREESRPGGPVEVTYVRGERAYRARARGVVLACYNMIIPYLCPELPQRQKEALHSLVKAPLVYTSVALRNWLAFDRLKLYEVHAPGSYHPDLHLNPHVNVGSYQSAESPSDPILVHMVRTPCQAGLPEFDQNRAGRAELLATSFETFERNIRDQLARTLKEGGFDPARDITAITVNRWPHGYAPEYNSLFDPDLPEVDRPHIIGRAQFGRITIANSDSGAAAYTDSAINQGYRAVMELLKS